MNSNFQNQLINGEAIFLPEKQDGQLISNLYFKSVSKSSLSFLNGINVEMRQHSKQQRLSARRHPRGTNLNNACAVPCEMKCEHATPLVLLDQSAIENIIENCHDKEGKKNAQ